MTHQLKCCDVIFGTFEFSDGRESKIRPLLVLDVREYGVMVAYGSTKKVGAPLEHEVELDEEEAAHVFLKHRTRFDLKKRGIMPLDLKHPKWRHYGPIGNLRSVKDWDVKLRHAARAADLV